MSCGGWQIVNGIKVWQNFTSCLTNSTNSADPIGGMIGSVGNVVPYAWPLLSWALYLIILFIFRDASGRWKWPGITFICLIMSLMMVFAGYTQDAIANVLLFGIAIVISTTFKT